jgi:hypothetical protein
VLLGHILVFAILGLAAGCKSHGTRVIADSSPDQTTHLVDIVMSSVVADERIVDANVVVVAAAGDVGGTASYHEESRSGKNIRVSVEPDQFQTGHATLVLVLQMRDCQNQIVVARRVRRQHDVWSLAESEALLPTNGR